MSDYVIPVTADTHARFFAQADELNLSSDAYIRQLLGIEPYEQALNPDHRNDGFVRA